MSKARHILVATGLFPPEIGGPATYSKKILDRLPAQGFRVTVLPFRLVRWLPPGIRHIAYFFLVLFRGIRADIIFAQDPVSVGLPALCAAKILGKRFYLKVVGDYAWEQGMQRFHVHDLLDVFVKEHEKYHVIVRVLKNIQSFVARGADRIVVPSEYLKTIVVAWGIAPDKIRVIYNSVVSPQLSADRDVLRQKFGFSGPTLISVGRLVPWKGFKTLINTLPELAKYFPDIKLVIAGSGPDREMLRAHALRLGVADRVLMTGELLQATLFEYVKAADLFVLNTAYEGFSHQLVEALALETPIVTTRVGGNPEIIEHGTNGILVEYDKEEKLASEIKHALTDTQETRKMAASGRDTIKKFTEERMIGDLATLLNS